MRHSVLRYLAYLPARSFLLWAILLLTAEAAHAQQDLVVNTNTGFHPGGTYRNVTINAGYLSLSGPLVETGAMGQARRSFCSAFSFTARY